MQRTRHNVLPNSTRDTFFMLLSPACLSDNNSQFSLDTKRLRQALSIKRRLSIDRRRRSELRRARPGAFGDLSESLPGSGLDNKSVLDDVYQIGSPYRNQPVRDEHYSHLFAQLLDRTQQFGLRLAVSALIASSISNRIGFDNSARAMPKRWRWPPESLTP